MTAFFYYLLKIFICSGVFYLYYLLILRNKLFHQWNRFYLLLAVVVSLGVPLVQFTIYNYLGDQPHQTIRLLQVVQSANEYLEEVTIQRQHGLTYEDGILLVYISISIFLFLILCRSLFRIYKLVKTFRRTRMDTVDFINTTAPGTPFSFFRFIFWNSSIDLSSSTGQQIFRHEMAHVEEKHTLDKLFMQAVLIIFWCNPFFWLIRQELKLIHEFIADKRSVDDKDTAALAAMILQSSYPAHFNSITNHFFQTSIKRRLHMLTKIQQTRLSYISRLLALPLAAFTILAFTVRTRNIAQPLANPDKEITVVIDAGHGYKANNSFTGARSGDIYEDQINLALAKKIKELNTNNKIKIILTRTTDDNVDLHKRVELARKYKADLFISIHVAAMVENANLATGANQEKNSGFQIYVSKDRMPVYQKQSEILGSVLQQELNTLYPTHPTLLKRNVGIWVLDRNICPSVLVECGFLTNEKDRAFITNGKNQEQVAEKILSGINRYLGSLENPNLIREVEADTIPKARNTDIKETFSKIEVEASIEMKEWRKFLEEHLQPVIEDAAKAGTPAGTYTVVTRFIVEKDGSINNFETVKDPGYGLAKKTIEILKLSPRWKPAYQNGRAVRSYHTQPLTFVIAEEKDTKEDTKTGL